MSFLELKSLRKTYGALAALEGVSLNVPAGSRTAIVGPSGSGKTTLLRIIAGFEAPDAGSVTLGGVTLAKDGSAVPAHKRGIGFVPQDGALFPHLTIGGNVGFGLPRATPQRGKRLIELLGMVALGPELLARYPHEVSGGQQQRVALARALAQRPKLMLLDEPFSALDTGLRASTRKATAQVLEAAGITTILVTHDQAEALSFADQVAVLRGGRLAQAGLPRDVYLHPADPEVAAFLGEAIVMAAELSDGFAECLLGRVAVKAGGRLGPAQIMLRPEQLHLAQVIPNEAAGLIESDICYGQVMDIDFSGSVCAVAVRILSGASRRGQDKRVTPNWNTPLWVRTSSLDVPEAGAMVRIHVAGRAHVFE